MKQVVQDYKTGKLSIEDMPMPKVKLYPSSLSHESEKDELRQLG